MAINANLHKNYQPLQFYKMSEIVNKKTFGLVGSPQNKKLIADLKTTGEEVLVFPPLNPVKNPLTEPQKALFQNLSGFDWIIFTDVYAADFFIEAMAETETDFFELDRLTVAALGEAVADRLRFVQAHTDVIPSNLSDKAVFSAISEYAGGDLQNLRFLVVCEESAGLQLTENLRLRGAKVEKLSIYRARIDDQTDNSKLKTLLRGGAVDEFVFSSAEDLIGLRFFGSGEDLETILLDTKISTTTEIAFQTLRENGFRPLYFHFK